MGLIIDSCIFIYAEKNQRVIDFTKWQEYENSYISAITASELLMGIHYANTEKRRLQRSALVEAILTNITILDFTLEVARIHAEIHAYLSKHGKLIGAHDLIIGATALAYDYHILTLNQKEFTQIPGLKLVNL